MSAVFRSGSNFRVYNDGLIRVFLFYSITLSVVHAISFPDIGILPSIFAGSRRLASSFKDGQLFSHLIRKKVSLNKELAIAPQGAE